MEVEVKFPYQEGVEEKIRNFAEFVIEKVEVDLYFNHPCRDFRMTDEAFRIRKDLEGVKITYKGPRIDRETKSREELKVSVNDFDTMVEILKRLGFREVRIIRKLRRIYRTGDVLICVDDVEGLGKFVEIEVESKDVGVKEKLFEIASKLGYSREESIVESYLEMIEKNKGCFGHNP